MYNANIYWGTWINITTTMNDNDINTIKEKQYQ